MWGFDLIIHPQVGEFDFPLDQIPTISPPSPYWGGWGLTLIGALRCLKKVLIQKINALNGTTVPFDNLLKVSYTMPV